MRYIEWLVLFVLAACGTGLANLIGYGWESRIPFPDWQYLL